MIHSKKNYDRAEEFKRMTVPQLRDELHILRQSPGREEAILQFQKDRVKNPSLTLITNNNFDNYYIDDVDVVIDELNTRATAQAMGGR